MNKLRWTESEKKHAESQAKANLAAVGVTEPSATEKAPAADAAQPAATPTSTVAAAPKAGTVATDQSPGMRAITAFKDNG